MGGSEQVIAVACEYLMELGLPCYCTKKQWNYLQNKSNFKDLCVRNGLPVVPKYEVTNESISIPNDAYPVITKPADGCGSSGFSLCLNQEELSKGYAIAREASDSGSVVVEKFVKNDSVVVFYTFSNGKAYFSGLENKYPVRYEQQGSYVAGVFLFESSFVSEFRENFDQKVEKMFQSIGLTEGSAWIEVFHDGSNYYFNEVGYRYGGSVSIYPVDYFYNINQVAADIFYALTGESCINGHLSLIGDRVKRKKHYCIYPLHIRPGKISSISGVDELLSRDNFVVVPTTKIVGDTVKSTGTVGQIFAFVHFVFDTLDDCKEAIQIIHETIKVLDENGENLTNRMLDFDARSITL